MASENSCRAGQPATDGSGSNVQSTSPWAKLKRFFGGDKLDRERLKALGVGAVLSYGVVSNVTYGGGMAVAWCGSPTCKHVQSGGTCKCTEAASLV